MRSSGLRGRAGRDQHQQAQEEMAVILKTRSGSGTEISSAVSKPQERTNPARAMCVQPASSNPSPPAQMEDLRRVLPALGPLGREEIQDRTSLC